MDKQLLGHLAENAAAQYLQEQGYKILERNFRTALGELDIIAEDGDYLVFVEVRSRKDSEYGLPQETVDWNKQSRVRRMANQYLNNKFAWHRNCRFDVVAVLFKNEIVDSLELLKDAF
ncbi:MAG: YraN family protein [Peptococcia bacterium]